MKEKEVGFKEQTALKTIIGLIIIVGICIVCYLVLRAGLLACRIGIVKIATTFSKMDVVVVVAFITGTLSCIAVCIGTVVGKVLESIQLKREYLTKKREHPYEEFVEMIYKIQMSTKKGNNYSEQQMIKDISRVSKQITLWGSSNVVNKWVEFRENSTNKEDAIKNLFILEEIMNDMRKDLGVRKVKRGNLLAFFVNDIKKAL